MKLILKEILRERKITQLTLADSIGITREAASYIINGKTAPSLKTLEKIADALGMNVWELFEDYTPINEVTGFIKVKGKVYEVCSFEDIEGLLKLRDGQENG